MGEHPLLTKWLEQELTRGKRTGAFCCRDRGGDGEAGYKGGSGSSGNKDSGFHGGWCIGGRERGVVVVDMRAREGKKKLRRTSCMGVLVCVLR